MTTETPSPGNDTGFSDLPITLLRAGEVAPEQYVSIPILNPDPWTRASYKVHVLADVLGLGLRAGMVLEMIAQTRVDCDSLYHLADGSFARLQCWGQPGILRVVRESGAVEFLSINDVAVQVHGCWTGRDVGGQHAA